MSGFVEITSTHNLLPLPCHCKMFLASSVDYSAVQLQESKRFDFGFPLGPPPSHLDT